jgi:hypothetical protein
VEEALCAPPCSPRWTGVCHPTLIAERMAYQHGVALWWRLRSNARAGDCSCPAARLLTLVEATWPCWSLPPGILRVSHEADIVKLKNYVTHYYP